MKRLLVVIIAMFLMTPALCQAKQINITKFDIRVPAASVKMNVLGKMLNYFLPSQVWAASCVAANPAMAAMCNGLIGASTAGLNGGKIVLRDAGNSVLATLTLNATLASATATNVLTFNAIADATATGAGGGAVCTNALVQNAAGTTFFTLDVGASGSVVMSSYTVTTGDTIHVTNVPTVTQASGT